MNGLFQSRDGTPLYYEVQGQGRPLIFCYGLLCRQNHWVHQLPLFSTRYQTILFDYRGHQRSGMPRNDRNLTLEWCAKDIQDLMAFLELKEAVCLGHSMGVPVLTHLAQLEPHKVKGNVFVCGSVNNPFERMFFTDRLDPLFGFWSRVNEWLPRAGSLLWKKFTGPHALAYFIASQAGFNPEVARPEDVRSYLEGVRETDPQVFYRLMQDYRRLDRTQLLTQMNCPTLVVAGEKDCITPLSVQKEIVKALPEGELAIISEGSHNAHMDFPQEVNDKIEVFLKRIGYQ